MKSTHKLPLHRLLLQLQHAGFSLSPADRLRVQQLLGHQPELLLSEEGLEELKYLLAPILARNDVEQEVFYRIYDQYRLTLAPPRVPVEEPEQKPSLRKLLLYVALAIGSALIIGILYSILSPDPVKSRLSVSMVEQAGRVNVPVGDTAHFVINSVGDTTDLSFQWRMLDLPDTLEERQLIDQHFWKIPVRAFESGNEKLIELRTFRGDSLLFTQRRPLTAVCGEGGLSHGGIEIQQIEERTYQFSIEVDNPDALDFYWLFGDGDSSRAVSPVHTYSVRDVVTVYAVLDNPNAEGNCRAFLQTDLNLNPRLVALSDYRLRRDKLQREMHLTTLSQVLPWLGLLSALGLIWFFWFPEEKKPPQVEMPQEVLLEKLEVSDHAPYTIPFRSKADFIELSDDQFSMANTLRRRQQGLRKSIDVPATVRATIDGGGFPSIHYSYNTKPTDYLFFIDLQSADSHQARLFIYLMQILQDQDVHIEVMYYRNTFHKLWNRYFPEGLNLDQVHRLHPERRLIIFGDAYQLLETRGDNALNAMSMASFRKWESHILVTPVPLASWTYKEARLYQLFPIFPADLTGLTAAVRFVAEELTEEDLPQTLNLWQEQLERSAVDVNTGRRWRKWKAYEEYFAERPELLRWVKALFIYPTPTWNVTIAIGKALGAPVNYENLLLLSRIPWLQEGEIPYRLWKEVWKKYPLNDADERVAREALKEELEAVRNQTLKGFAERELEVGLAVQKFTLDPAVPENQKAIELLLAQGELDNLQLEGLDRVAKRQMVTKKGVETGKVGEGLKAFLDQANAIPEPVEEQSNTRHPLFWVGILLALVMLGVGYYTLTVTSDQLYRLVGLNTEEERSTYYQSTWMEEIGKAASPAVTYNNLAVSLYNEWLLSQSEASPENQSSKPPVDTNALILRKPVIQGKLTLNSMPARLLLTATRRDSTYQLAKQNLSRYYFNTGNHLYREMFERRTSVIDALMENLEITTDSFYRPSLLAEWLFVEATQSDSTRLDALHGLGLVYHYTNRKAESCEILAALEEAEYFETYTQTPNLLTISRCDVESRYTIEIRVNQGADQGFIRRLQLELRNAGFEVIPRVRTLNTNQHRVLFKDDLDREVADELARLTNEYLRRLPSNAQINYDLGIEQRDRVEEQNLILELLLPVSASNSNGDDETPPDVADKRNKLMSLKADLRDAEDAIRIHRESLDRAEKAQERGRKLLAQQVISQVEYDKLLAEVSIAKERYEDTMSTIERLKNQISTLEAELNGGSPNDSTGDTEPPSPEEPDPDPSLTVDFMIKQADIAAGKKDFNTAIGIYNHIVRERNLEELKLAYNGLQGIQNRIKTAIADAEKLERKYRSNIFQAARAEQYRQEALRYQGIQATFLDLESRYRATIRRKEAESRPNEQGPPPDSDSSSEPPRTGSFTDPRDGQTYKWVILRDGKKWMAENLNYERYESYCYDDNPENCKEYGRLYTWDAAMGACPEGWRLPSYDEWKGMTEYYGGSDGSEEAYGALIEGGSTRFDAILGGGRFSRVSYHYLGEYGSYWSSTEYGIGSGYYRFGQPNGQLRYYGGDKKYRFSCRCLQD